MLSDRCPVLSCPVCLCVCLIETLVYCGQTVAWIKTKLGTAVGLGPGHIVLDGDPAPSPKRGTAVPTIFGPCLLWPNGWMDQDATWYGGRLRPWPHCVRWETQLPPSKGAQPLIFGRCLLWPNGRQSQLLLSTCWTVLRNFQWTSASEQVTRSDLILMQSVKFSFCKNGFMITRLPVDWRAQAVHLWRMGEDGSAVDWQCNKTMA